MNRSLIPVCAVLAGFTACESQPSDQDVKRVVAHTLAGLYTTAHPNDCGADTAFHIDSLRDIERGRKTPTPIQTWPVRVRMYAQCGDLLVSGQITYELRMNAFKEWVADQANVSDIHFAKHPRRNMKDDLVRLAPLQEDFFSRNFHYTASPDSLGFRGSEGSLPPTITPDNRNRKVGFTATIQSRLSPGVTCAIGYNQPNPFDPTAKDITPVCR